MNFIADKIKLQNAVNIVQKAVGLNTTIPALSGILIETKANEIAITCNNLEIAIKATIPAKVKKSGKTLVNARLFGDIIRKMSGDETTVQLKENGLIEIIGDNSRFDISAIPNEEFPELPDVKDEFSFEIPEKEAKALIKGTAFAASVDIAKLILTGCLIETKGKKVRFVALDGYRIAMREAILEKEIPENKIVVPAKALNELNKILEEKEEEVFITATKKNIAFAFSNIIFTSRLLEGEYMDYQKILPIEFSKKVTLNRQEAQDAVERVALIVTNESTKSPIEVIIESRKMRFVCENQIANAEEKMNSPVEGEDLHIGFSHRFLIETMRACTGDEIVIEFSTEKGPCKITPAKGDKYLLIVLPVKLKGQ